MGWVGVIKKVKGREVGGKIERGREKEGEREREDLGICSMRELTKFPLV